MHQIRTALRGGPSSRLLITTSLFAALALTGCVGMPSGKSMEVVRGGYAEGDKLGVLLPATGPYAKVAESVREGVKAARGADDTAHVPELVDADTADAANAPGALSGLVNEGATYAVGPLQKDGVDALYGSANVAVPTLALNEGTFAGKPPANLYQFALSPENDAAQVAAKAKSQGLTRALMLYPADRGGERRAEAFRRQWRTQGGTLVGEATLGSDAAKAVGDLLAKGDADFVFLAADAEQAMAVYPELRGAAGGMPVIATADVYDGNPNAGRDKALTGLYFVDMPWMLGVAAQGEPLKRSELQPGAAYMANPLGRRLFAMGIDAYRLPPHLGKLAADPAASLPGQTGTLSLDSLGRIQRDLTLAQFTETGPVVVAGMQALAAARPEPR